MESYVFGYGSLSHDAAGSTAAQLAHLRGYRRTWQVAMDNRITIPGYKYYVERNGDRPDVFVTFLDLDAADGIDCVGVLLPVSAERLSVLDVRERNYDRIEVSDRIAEPPGGRVWTYVGSEAGRARYEQGRQTGTAIVHAEYLAGVEAEFRRRGEQVYGQYLASTLPPACPLRSLRRIELGPV